MTVRGTFRTWLLELMTSVRWVKADIAVASVDLIYVRSSHGWGWSNLWSLSAQDRWASFTRKKLELNTKSHFSTLREGFRLGQINAVTLEVPATGLMK
jgi:hypothetical protein